MPMPTNPVGLYWVWWNPFQRLSAFPTTYNVLFLFHAYPPDTERTIVGGVLQNPGGETGRVDYREPAGTIGSNLNADIATCRARGQKVIVSVGGAGGQIYLTDHATSHPLNVPGAQARADNFIQSIKDLNVQFGGSGTTMAFDGVDFNNFEGGGSSAVWMSYVAQELKAYYGTDFLITSPPAAFGGGQDVADRLILATMYDDGALDWLCPQFYDPTGLNTLANVRYYLDFYHTAVTVNGHSVTIPRDHIGIGYGITPGAGTGSRWSTTNAASAYDTVVADGRAPKGGFNWSNEEDTGNLFASQVATHFTNNTSSALPAFSLSLSSNFTNGTATTAQLIAPSGKTAGVDFQAGLISESSNPVAQINLASDKYTEIEWCIQASTDAIDAAQYEFRVTADGVAFTTYSVTPKWTIGTPIPPATTRSATGVGTMTGVLSITI